MICDDEKDILEIYTYILKSKYNVWLLGLKKSRQKIARNIALYQGSIILQIYHRNQWLSDAFLNTHMVSFYGNGSKRYIVIKSMQLKLMIVYIINTVEIISSDRRRRFK